MLFQLCIDDTMFNETCFTPLSFVLSNNSNLILFVLNEMYWQLQCFILPQGVNCEEMTSCSSIPNPCWFSQNQDQKGAHARARGTTSLETDSSTFHPRLWWLLRVYFAKKNWNAASCWEENIGQWTEGMSKKKILSHKPLTLQHVKIFNGELEVMLVGKHVPPK